MREKMPNLDFCLTGLGVGVAGFCADALCCRDSGEGEGRGRDWLELPGVFTAILLGRAEAALFPETLSAVVDEALMLDKDSEPRLPWRRCTEVFRRGKLLCITGLVLELSDSVGWLSRLGRGGLPDIVD